MEPTSIPDLPSETNITQQRSEILWGDTPFKLSSVKSQTGFEKLEELARKGSWRALLEAVKEAKKLSVIQSPHEQMAYSTYHVLALAKLGSYGAASEELSLLGDLDSKKFRYEEYPEYHGKSGSLVPFSLRWLHTQLPHRLGQTSVTIDRLYSLLKHCNQRMGSLSDSLENTQDNAQADATVNVRELLNKWKRRHHIVAYSLMNIHLLQKDFATGLKLLDQMLSENLTDPFLWSKFAYIQLQLGDLEGAKSTFTKVESLVKEKLEEGDSTDNEALVSLLGRHKGLQLFVEKDYAAAIRAFNGILDINPGDAICANNKALSLMYSRDLIRATQVLEDVLQKNTIHALNETLVLNLSSMYELAAVNSNESKKSLSTWMIRVAPDDFDLTCTRL